MSVSSDGLRMTVHLSENDQHRHRPLYTEIVHRAHAAGLAGATVLRGIEGYGASSRIHTSRIISLTEDLPVLVVIVDTPDRIKAFLPEIEQIAGAGLITIEEVEIVHHPHGADGPRESR